MIFGLLLAISSQLSAAPTITISDNWIREAPPNAKMLAAYFTITNTGNSSKTLVAAHCAAFKQVEIHRSMKQGNMSGMVQQKHVVIEAGKSVKFEPGSYHLMLMNPTTAIKAKQKHDITFEFADNSKMTISFPVVKRSGGDQHEHMHQDTKKDMPQMDMDHQHSHDM